MANDITPNFDKNLALGGNDQLTAPGMTPAVAREVATVQGSIFMAKQFPRNPDLAIKRIQADCSRLSLASCALYSYVRGGTEIQGPSIRLAEALARSWGNISCGFEVLESSRTDSSVYAYSYDLETNFKEHRTFKVPHTRDTKRGSVALTDARDIYERVANDSSRRLRVCILACIPADVVEYAVELCKETLRKNFEVNTATIQTILDTFAEFGISREHIEAKIQRKMEAMTPDMYANLRAVFQSLKDGAAKPEDHFDMSIQPAGAQAPLTAPKAEPAQRKPRPIAETAQPASDADMADVYGL